jgi:hypothetical protein
MGGAVVRAPHRHRRPDTAAAHDALTSTPAQFAEAALQKLAVHYHHDAAELQAIPRRVASSSSPIIHSAPSMG